MYLCVYFGSVFLAAVATPVVIWLAYRLGVLDRGSVRAVHKKPIPRIGGVAIFLAAMCMIVSVLFIDSVIGEEFRGVRRPLVTLLEAATFVFLVGFLDDLHGLPARVKLVAEIVAAGVLCHVGIRINALQITNGYVLDFGSLTCPLTILWIVGITNAVNLSDGLDGLAAGISAIACAVIALFAVHSQNYVMAVLMLALLGGLTGFLFFNFNPAKVFMGDCGSLFVGFTIASASVMCLTKSSTLVGLALPALALGIPIFDTLFSMLRRFLERRSMFAPDRGHFHHRLMDLGLRQRHAVIAIYAATCVATGLGLFMMVRQDAGSLVILGCLLFLLILLFRVVGAVHFRATLLGLQNKYASAQSQKQERRTFEDLQLQFRQVRDGREWWRAVCNAAERFDFAWVSLTTTNEQGNTDVTVWRGTSIVPKGARVVTMNMPLIDARSRVQSEVEIAIIANSSVESASRRGVLFGRLIDERHPTWELTASYLGEYGG